MTPSYKRVEAFGSGNCLMFFAEIGLFVVNLTVAYIRDGDRSVRKSKKEDHFLSQMARESHVLGFP